MNKKLIERPKASQAAAKYMLLCWFLLHSGGVISSAMVVTKQQSSSSSSQARIRAPPRTTTSSGRTTTRPTTLFSALTTQHVVYDGPEWSSLQDCLDCQNNGSSSATAAEYGRMTVVVGTNEEGEKVVGVLAETKDNQNNNNNNNAKHHKTVPLKEQGDIFQESMARVPNNVKDQDAIQTMIAALTGIHCTVPKVEGVGGAEKEESKMTVSGKVVILGGGDYACFAAQGLAALGSSVSIVSTKKPSLPKNSNNNHENNIQVIPPAVGDDEIGFASFVGDFDALLDTAQNERPSRRPLVVLNSDDDDDDDDDDGDSTVGGSMVLRLLKERHNCDRYISSMTRAQKIVNSDGVFFGPGKVKEYFANLQKKLESQPALFEAIVPPASFGQTVETLLEKGILYKSSKGFLNDKNSQKTNVIARGWSLQDLMEVNMWPTNSAGGGTRTIRYGLPVVDDDDEEDEDLISAPPQTADQQFIQKEKWDEDIAQEERARDKADQRNPYVKKIVGANQLHETIVKDEKDAVLFMSATWCRTCRSLNPKFTYMARQKQQQQQENKTDNDDAGGSEDNKKHNNGILFAKADTTGEVGKDLGRLLNVDSVPAFLLFRNGRRFGPPLSISKMPSKKLKVAIELLESGLDWDSDAIREAEKKSR